MTNQLTEDDFRRARNCLSIESIGSIKSYLKMFTDEEQQILSNQEKAKKYDELKNTKGVDDIVRQRVLILDGVDFSIEKIQQNQKVVERLKELFADQKLLCGKCGGKKGYEKEYEVARNILLKLQAVLDGKE